jgi:phospholipid-binding lipoprotein MlaA
MYLPLFQASLLATASSVTPPPATAPLEEQQSVEVVADDLSGAEEGADQGPAQDSDVIVVEGSVRTPAGDPLASVNETTFQVTQEIDSAIVEPMSEVYEEELPKPVRNGLRNFLRNLMEPVNFINYLLQLKPGKAIETLGRFAINTTIGIGGLIDVAEEKPFNLPYRRNGFANTLGYYGVGPGPYLVLPLVGSTTVRDLLGSGLDQLVLPLAVGKPFNTPYYAIPAYTVNSLQYRMEFDERLDAIEDSHDPYTAMRRSYLCLREADIAALRDLPPPQDCSIDSLMGYNDDYSDLDEEQVDEAPDPLDNAISVEPAPVAETR